jgi:kumamolisin
MQRLTTFGYSPRLYYDVVDHNAGGNAYFDITSGNNLYYPATAGWDYATELGSPNLASFDQAVSKVLA